MFFFLLIVIFVTAAYFYSVRNHDYWKKKNVKHDTPIPLFGNQALNLFGMKGMIEVSVDMYNKYPNEKVVGYYRCATPELIIRDLELIRKILAADFPHFYNRGFGFNTDLNPLFGSLFHADGDKWKLLRQRLTPAFTTAKLRAMFPLVVRCAERLQDVVMELANRGATYDARDLMARFTTEFIGACGFGIEMDTINNEHSYFLDFGKRLLERTFTIKVLIFISELFPEIKNVFRTRPKQIENEFRVLLEQIRSQRNYKPIGRHDFIDLLLELEAKGKILGESIEKFKEDGTPVPVEMEMDFNCQMAQVFLFFAAGFDTSSHATSHTLHLLAYHPEAQRRIQEEIDNIMQKYDDKLCYDAIAEMTLLDMAFNEAMRMLPSIGVLNRICTRKYEIPELGIAIDPGVKILIPLQAIYMDEKYFDNPKEFRPERFSPEAIKKRHNFSYLPFGEGPRACVGARLGQMQSLAGLASILHKFSVEPAESSRHEIKLGPSSDIAPRIVGKMPLNFKIRGSKRATSTSKQFI
ncbi:cytochrome P450 6B6-like [Pectinophora gossypiella]|uniref:cytochrome P450 6B6-like n=1 Tax=Pectinophora gossypiella TaxID=13191 RepID=UPI00214ED4CF|nr:cytochrome P450 6B6-like [Pectinophora gossypiella]